VDGGDHDVLEVKVLVLLECGDERVPVDDGEGELCLLVDLHFDEEVHEVALVIGKRDGALQLVPDFLH